MPRVLRRLPMRSLRSTIRHASTRESIIAYLAIYPFALPIRRIKGYMNVVHMVGEGATQQQLSCLAKQGVITRVRLGWYQSMDVHGSVMG
jgi:hypothetical protein